MPDPRITAATKIIKLLAFDFTRFKQYSPVLARDMLDAIHLASTITDEEELESFPRGTKVLHDGFELEKECTDVWVNRYEDTYTTSEILPARLTHFPYGM